MVGGGGGICRTLHLRGEVFQTSVVADHLQHVARIQVGGAVGDVDTPVAAQHGRHVHTAAPTEVERLQRLPRPVGESRQREPCQVHIVGGQPTRIAARRALPRGRFALTEVLTETPLDADALVLDEPRAQDEKQQQEGRRQMIVPGEGRKIFDDVEEGVDSQQQTHAHRDAYQQAPREMGAQRARRGRIVLAHHDRAHKHRHKPQREQARHRIAHPVGEQAAQHGQQGGETQHDGGENEHAVDERLQHSGFHVLAGVARQPAFLRGGGGSARCGSGTFGGHAVGIDAFEPMSEAAREQPVGRVGQADHVGREERGDDAHRHDNGVEVGARHLERDAQRRDDEGKFADLRERKSTIHGPTQRMPGHDERERAEHHLTAQHGERDDQHRAPMGHQDAGIDHHAHRNEEDGTEKILDGRDEVLNFFGFEGFGENTAHDESAEGRGVAGAIGQHDEHKAQTDRNDQQGFVVDEGAGAAQKGWHNVDPHHKPQHQEETQRKEALDEFAALELLRNGCGREDNHEQDAENVLENQHRKHFARKTLAAQTQIVEGFVDDGGGGHGEHAAQKQTVGAAPIEKAPGGATHPDHAAHDHRGREDGAHAHCRNLLDRKLQTEREHEEDHPDAAPRLDRTVVLHRGHVGHVRAGQKTGHNVAQHQGLFEAFEQHGDQTGHNKNERKVGNERGKAVHKLKK